MSDYIWPFPTKDLAARELSYDPFYKKIPEEDRQDIIDIAWERGQEAAYNVYVESHGETDLRLICRKYGLKLIHEDKDRVIGGQRYFSEYISGKREIILYMKGIKLWGTENGMELYEAENLVLSHEFYHFLEWTKLGLTSKEYKVPILRIGKITIGETGIRALSEIGAHGFAERYHHLIIGDD